MEGLKIEFFCNEEKMLDKRAINSGIYHVELLMRGKDERLSLYIGESTYMVKRCGEHLYNFLADESHFGLNKENLANEDFVLKFSVLKSLPSKETSTQLDEEEKLYIQAYKPLTQYADGKKGDNQLDDRVEIVQRAITNIFGL